MNNLLQFLVRHNHWIVFVLLEVICVSLLVRYNSYQSSVWFSSANFVAGEAYSLMSQVGSYFTLGSANKQLTERNAYLEQQLNILENKLADATSKDTLHLGNQAKMFNGYHLIPAKVVSSTLNKTDNLLTIDKGSRDGIKVDMGVVCGNGIVGIVYLVSDNYSVVIPVLNSHSSISTSIRKRGYFGLLHWTGGDTRKAYVDDIPRHAHFRLGDIVETSGYSSVFPPGISIGKILHVFNSADGLSYRLQIELSTDYGLLRDVCVVDNTVMQERIDLMRAAQDSLKLTTHN